MFVCTDISTLRYIDQITQQMKWWVVPQSLKRTTGGQIKRKPKSLVKFRISGRKRHWEALTRSRTRCTHSDRSYHVVCTCGRSSQPVFDNYLARYGVISRGWLVGENGLSRKKIVPPKNFILGQKFSAIMLKIFVLPWKFLSAWQNLVCLIFHQHYMYPTA